MGKKRFWNVSCQLKPKKKKKKIQEYENLSDSAGEAKVVVVNVGKHRSSTT